MGAVGRLHTLVTDRTCGRRAAGTATAAGIFGFARELDAGPSGRRTDAAAGIATHLAFCAGVGPATLRRAAAQLRFVGVWVGVTGG
jgi:hypothetical protein